MENLQKYLDVDFGKYEKDPDTGKDSFHIDGYVYYSECPDESEKPYRHVQFTNCFIPSDKVKEKDFIWKVEEQVKQYETDIDEKTAKEIINMYLNNSMRRA